MKDVSKDDNGLVFLIENDRIHLNESRVSPRECAAVTQQLGNFSRSFQYFRVMFVETYGSLLEN